MRRMPSSINEKAQSSIEPKIMGVKISNKMRIYFMNLSIIAQSSKLNAQNKTANCKESSKHYYDFLLEIELISPFNIDTISLARVSSLE